MRTESATGKRPQKKPERLRVGPGSGSKVDTPKRRMDTSVSNGAAKRRRDPSIRTGAQDALADAAMLMDARDPPGSHPKPADRSRNKTQKAALEASEEAGDSGEEEDDGEGGEDSADGAAGEEGEEESSGDDDDDGEDGGSEDSKQESGCGSDSEALSEAERAGQRKLAAASAAKRPKVSDKVVQGKKAVEAGGGKVKVGQGNKIGDEKPVKESSTQGKKDPKVMLVIICDISQSG